MTNYYDAMADALAAQALAHELLAEADLIDPNKSADDQMWSGAFYLNHAHSYRKMAISYRVMAAAWRERKGDAPVEVFPF